MSHKNKQLSSNFLQCIRLEQEADLQQTEQLLRSLPPKKLAQKGLAILNLISESIKTGLGGRTILELAVDSAIGDNEVKTGDIRVGDIVKVEKMGKSTDDEEATSIEGVIQRISQISIVITVDEKHEETALSLGDSKLWIVKLSNSVTYKRMESTMRKLSEFESLPSELFQVLLNEKKVTPNTKDTHLDLFNGHLNGSQIEAIKFSLQNIVSIIHGPPGTGKTYTLIEIIKQLTLNKGERVLVCGPSNISIDTILERLAKKTEKASDFQGDDLIRVGHPARILPSILNHCLDLVNSFNDNGAIVKDLKNEIDSLLKKKLKKTKSYRERREVYQEVKELRKDLRVREKKYVDEVILNSKVVLSTLHGASSRELTNLYKNGNGDQCYFDTIIIDEVSQSLEPQCWIPLISHFKAKRLIIAGDNKQLPPTIKLDTNEKIKEQLERTLFDRLVESHGDSFKKMLKVQYRMNDKIMKFPSEELYGGELTSADSCHDITLLDFPDVEETDDTMESLIWYDTQGGEFPERDDSEENDEIISSKYNEMEILLVKHHIEKLVNSGVSMDKIGIISPYNAQVSRLKKFLAQELCKGDVKPNTRTTSKSKSKVKRKSKDTDTNHKDQWLEISTVDGFQGREKEVIIISMVRSNDDGEVGFLKDYRRLNVAITRAKRQLVIIGDMETLNSSSNKFLTKLTKWMELNSLLIYPDVNDIL